MVALLTPENLGPEFDLGQEVPNKITLRLGKGLVRNQQGKICAIGGVVNADGSLHRSSGLQMNSVRMSKGLYQISFAEPPGATDYSVHLTPARPPNGDDLSIWYTNVLPGSFTVEIRRQDNGAAGGVFKDNAFSFLVLV